MKNSCEFQKYGSSANIDCHIGAVDNDGTWEPYRAAFWRYVVFCLLGEATYDRP